MKRFFVWYDNGSGWFEAHGGAFPVEAATAEEALSLINAEAYLPYTSVVTASSDESPNYGGKILASVSSRKCQDCGGKEDPDHRGLAIGDEGVLGGQSSCGDAHRFV